MLENAEIGQHKMEREKITEFACCQRMFISFYYFFLNKAEVLQKIAENMEVKRFFELK